MTYILYGGEISYYTGKARAYLRFKDIPFEERAASRDVYKQVILPRVGWPVIPVVITPEDETLQDTSDIIDALESRFPQTPVYPSGPVQRLVALLFELYGDEWLKLPAMHYRWNYNYDWIIREFGALTRPDLSPDEQLEAGTRAARGFHGSLPVLGINDATIPAIERSYEAVLDELQTHFSRHSYLLGSRPSVGDFGLFGPMYAHLYRDPESGALMKRRAPAVAAWVERLHAPEPNGGTFLEDDEVPETLLPILRRMMREQLPVLERNVAATQSWLKENPGEEEIPRLLGMGAFELGGAKSESGLFTFDQWMLQRSLDHYGRLDGEEKVRADALLRAVGGEGLWRIPIDVRVLRRNFQLRRA